jgi:acetyltransferase-like isoleucine patch superfamily enzyme
MKRVHEIAQRYGWRTWVVVPIIAAARLWDRLRNGLLLQWLRLKTLGRKGQHIYCGRQVSMTTGGWIDIGNDVYIGERSIIDVLLNPRGSVSIGNDTWISHDCHIVSYGKVRVGQHVLIGEFVSIRDTTHNYQDTTVPVKHQSDIIGSILIDDDVWIGRGSLILGRPEGITIGRGAIIGANSVVSASVPAMSVMAGAPARLIKMRNARAETTELPQ